MPPVNTPNQAATVLVVDDGTSARERLCAIFEKAGYRALIAHDAASTLRIVQTEPCDLVVVNFEMSGADGLGVCRLLRARPSTSRLPVIAISNSVEEGRQTGLHAGR